MAGDTDFVLLCVSGIYSRFELSMPNEYGQRNQNVWQRHPLDICCFEKLNGAGGDNQQSQVADWDHTPRNALKIHPIVKDSPAIPKLIVAIAVNIFLREIFFTTETKNVKKIMTRNVFNMVADRAME